MTWSLRRLAYFFYLISNSYVALRISFEIKIFSFPPKIDGHQSICLDGLLYGDIVIIVEGISDHLSEAHSVAFRGSARESLGL
jgi:hypothetical protein